MCEQCICETVHCGEILPGWFLVQAKKDGTKGEMKAGMHGLVQCNDPDFRFKTKPYPDPLRDLDPAHKLGVFMSGVCNEFEYDLQAVASSVQSYGEFLENE